MKLLPLTKGFFAQVDDSDYQYLSQFKWHIIESNKTFYARRTISLRELKDGESQNIYLHREILKAIRGQIIDHIDRNGLNCQRENLRFCTAEQNQANRGKESGKISQYKGVYYYRKRNKWFSLIINNGVRYHIGVFVNEADAAKAYDKKALELNGEFANLNFK